jgi:hypothetical protein
MADFNKMLRDRMLHRAVLQAGDDPTLATVAAHLPLDFFSADTDEIAANETELADMIARIAAETPEPDPATEPDEPMKDAKGHGSEPAKEPPSLSFQEARSVITDWANKLSAARGRHMSAVSRQQAGRLRVEAAVAQLVSGLPKKTQEDLKREYLASEAERRQRVADGLEPPTGGTRNVPTGFLTAMRRGQRGHNVNHGYGNNYIKKAASLIAQQEALGLKPAVGAPKLPSQR